MSGAAHPPSETFVAALRRRIRPEHRLVTTRMRVTRGLGWALALMCPAILLVVTGVLLIADAPRQLALDTVASLGLGSARPEARIGGVSCSFHRGTGRLGMNEHRCIVGVLDGGERLRLDIRAGDALTRADAGKVVGVLGQPAIAWSAEVMWGRWWRMLPAALPFILLAPLAWGAVQMIRSHTRLFRAIAGGEPRPADLLRRRAGRGRHPLTHWEIAFDHAGERRRARVEASVVPIVLDRAATRGVVLAAPDGSVALLQAQGWPLTLDAATASWLTERAEAMRMSDRPVVPAAVADRFPAGPERDYAMAFALLSQAEGGANEAFHAATEQLHKAAARLGPARVDALLQALRAAMPPA